MKIEITSFPQETKLPIDTIYYFQEPDNAIRNSTMMQMTEICPTLKFPNDIQQFSYNLSSVPSKDENEISLIVQLANHFQDEKIVENHSDFLIGKFEAQDKVGIVTEFMHFMLEATQLNFERLTGISYQHYLNSKSSNQNRPQERMMGFMTVHDPSAATEALLKKRCKELMKFYKENAIPDETIEQFFSDILRLAKQEGLCQRMCELQVVKGDLGTGIFYLKDDIWKLCDFGDNDYKEVTLYIFFLQRAVKIAKVKKSKQNMSVSLGQIRGIYREEIENIGKHVTGRDFSRQANEICEKPLSYINKINKCFRKIFKKEVAEKYCISEFTDDNNNTTYGILLNTSYIDLGEFTI